MIADVVLHGAVADVFVMVVFLILIVLVMAVIWGTLQGILEWLKRKGCP